MNQLLTVFLTVISGVLVFVGCECIKEICLNPLQEYKKLKSRIAYSLSTYSMNVLDEVDVLTSGKKLQHYDDDVASREFLSLSSEIRGFIETLSWLKILIPSKKKLYEVSISLRKIAYAILDDNNIPDEYDIYVYFNKNYDLICNNLKIYKNEE